jgi:hypothetical protein
MTSVLGSEYGSRVSSRECDMKGCVDRRARQPGSLREAGQQYEQHLTIIDREMHTMCSVIFIEADPAAARLVLFHWQVMCGYKITLRRKK